MLLKPFHNAVKQIPFVWKTAAQSIKAYAEVSNCKSKILSELTNAELMGRHEHTENVTFSTYQHYQSMERLDNNLDELFQVAPVTAMRHATELLEDYGKLPGQALRDLLDKMYIKSLSFLSENPATQKSHPSELRARLGLWVTLHNRSESKLNENDVKTFSSDLELLQHASGNAEACRVAISMKETPTRTSISGLVASVAQNIADEKPALKN